jgi:hypothetical protein
LNWQVFVRKVYINNNAGCCRRQRRPWGPLERLLATRSPCRRDWPNALPLSSAGLTIDNGTVSIRAVLDPKRRSYAHRYACVYGDTITVDGHHGLSRRRRENSKKSVSSDRTDYQRKVQRPPETGFRTLTLCCL